MNKIYQLTGMSLMLVTATPAIRAEETVKKPEFVQSHSMAFYDAMVKAGIVDCTLKHPADMPPAVRSTYRSMRMRPSIKRALHQASVMKKDPNYVVLLLLECVNPQPTGPNQVTERLQLVPKEMVTAESWETLQKANLVTLPPEYMRTGAFQHLQTIPTYTPPPATLPITKTIKDSAGRAMDVTILSKTDKGVKFTRTADQKTFELPMSKLSAEDQTFLGTVQNGDPNANGIKVLLIDLAFNQDAAIIKTLKKEGFDLSHYKIPDVFTPKLDVAMEINDAVEPNELENHIRGFDVVWLHNYTAEIPLKKEILTMANKQSKIVVVDSAQRGLTANDVLSGVKPKSYSKFVKTDGNMILYHADDRQIGPDGNKTFEPDTDILQSVIQDLKKLKAGQKQ